MGRGAQEASRFRELDALRGIAAVAVMWHHLVARYFEDYGSGAHLVPRLPFSGTHAVCLFFIISGFVIFMSVERATPREFALSRFSRIFPAYWVCVLLTFGVVGVFGLPGREVDVTALAINMTMLHAYFSVPHVDGVYWSLAYELPFYAIAYVLLAKRVLTRYPYHVAGAWLAYSAVYAGLRNYFGFELPVVIELLTVASFAPLFVAGIMFYQVHMRRDGWHTHMAIATCLVLHVILHASSKMGLLVSCAIFFIFYLATYGLLGFLVVRPLIWLGFISYPLYLLHDNIGMVSLRTLTQRGFNYDVALVITVALVLTISGVVSYRVERPAMKWLRRKWSAASAPTVELRGAPSAAPILLSTADGPARRGD